MTLCPLAMKHASSGSPHVKSASQLATNLVNVRSISAHFRPKIDAWSASHQVVSITPEQVCTIVTCTVH